MGEMDYSIISQLITNQGFPVVSCIALFYILYKELINNRKTTEKFINAINKNSQMIESLELLLKERDYLEIEESDKGN